jgi:phosphoribosylglycinamide formyltransferase-1
MPERFIGEDIKPVATTFDTTRMAAGEPGLPGQFLWRDRTIEIAAVLRTWHETGNCDHGSPEQYVRKHWYEIVTTTGETMKIYFERQPRRGEKGSRWRLLSMAVPGESNSP